MKTDVDSVIIDADIFPVIPDKPQSREEFLADVKESLLANQTLQEAALTLWNQKTDARTIMNFLGLDEASLDKLIPKSLWRGRQFQKCGRCQARGYFSIDVPWEQDDSHNRPGLHGTGGQ
jgi:hypothetical protein